MGNTCSCNEEIDEEQNMKVEPYTVTNTTTPAQSLLIGKVKIMALSTTTATTTPTPTETTPTPTETTTTTTQTITTTTTTTITTEAEKTTSRTKKSTSPFKPDSPKSVSLGKDSRVSLADDPVSSSSAASSSSTVMEEPHSGYIMKKGKMNSKYKNFFFVLENKKISYYVDNSKKDKRGEISLPRILKIEGTSDNCNRFFIKTDTRKYCLESQAPDEKIKWMDLIQKKKSTLLGLNSSVILKDIPSSWEKMKSGDIATIVKMRGQDFDVLIKGSKNPIRIDSKFVELNEESA